VERARFRARDIIVGTLGPVPSIKETLIRSIVLGSGDTAMIAQQHADLVITPDIHGIALTDWARIDEMREAGRAAARAALETAPELAGER
jgi:predicted acylesterase/phospholipase RssA